MGASQSETGFRPSKIITARQIYQCYQVLKHCCENKQSLGLFSEQTFSYFIKKNPSLCLSRTHISEKVKTHQTKIDQKWQRLFM